MSEFILHPRLEQDSYFITDLELSRMLLNKNANFPWIMLVPRIADVSEVLDLSLNHREVLWKEIEFIANSLKEIYIPDKLNIAMLGNIVNQLHVHIVARFKSDIAFPGTIWADNHPKAEYKNPEAIITKLRKEIGCRVRKA